MASSSGNPWGLPNIEPDRLRQDLRAIGECDNDVWAESCWIRLYALVEVHCRRDAREDDVRITPQDIACEVLRKFKEKAGSIEVEHGIASLMKWFKVTIYRHVCDLREKEKKVLPMSQGGQDDVRGSEIDLWKGAQRLARERRLPGFEDDDDVLTKVARRDEIERMEQAKERILRSLSPRNREVVSRALKGEKHTDIARSMGLTANNVDQVYHRFLTALGRKLRELDGSGNDTAPSAD